MKNNPVLVMMSDSLQERRYWCGVPTYHHEKGGIEVDKIRKALS